MTFLLRLIVLISVCSRTRHITGLLEYRHFGSLSFFPAENPPTIWPSRRNITSYCELGKWEWKNCVLS